MEGECAKRAEPVVSEDLSLRADSSYRIGLMVMADGEQLGEEDQGRRESGNWLSSATAVQVSAQPKHHAASMGKFTALYYPLLLEALKIVARKSEHRAVDFAVMLAEQRCGLHVGG